VTFSNRANATAEELKQYQEIAANGTKVMVQYILADKELPLETFL